MKLKFLNKIKGGSIWAKSMISIAIMPKHKFRMPPRLRFGFGVPHDGRPPENGNLRSILKVSSKESVAGLTCRQKYISDTYPISAWVRFVQGCVEKPF